MVSTIETVTGPLGTFLLWFTLIAWFNVGVAWCYSQWREALREDRTDRTKQLHERARIRQRRIGCARYVYRTEHGTWTAWTAVGWDITS